MNELELRDDRVVIVGAGIAGLTTAITLAQAGVRSLILEQRSEFSEAGAGIQLGPNATHILGELGVLEALRPKAVAPDAIVVAEARSGRQIAKLPLGTWIEERHGAPYLVAHRADLQRALVHKARAHDKIEIRLGLGVEGIHHPPRSQSDHDPTIELSDGRTLKARFIVGGDGLWSALRGLAEDNVMLRFSGMTAARALVDITVLPETFRKNETRVWLAPDAHVVMYPVSGGTEAALVIITTAPEPKKGWASEVDKKVLFQGLGGVNDDLLSALDAADAWRQWALFDPQPIKVWSWRNIQLIGDAAHPMLPFIAQGGAMAIEDGHVLGRLIGQHGPEPTTVFPAFEAVRRQRVEQIQRASRENGRIYHLKGFAARARNIGMRALPPQRLMQRHDWIYRWRYDPDFGEVEL